MSERNRMASTIRGEIGDAHSLVRLKRRKEEDCWSRVECSSIRRGVLGLSLLLCVVVVGVGCCCCGCCGWTREREREREEC